MASDFLLTPPHESRPSESPVYHCTAEFRPPDPPYRSYAIPSIGRVRASGKGWTAEEARAGCLGEAAERYSAMYRDDEPLILAPYKEVEAHCVSPTSLLQYSARQYGERDVWNAAFEGCQFVPEPWDTDEPLEWVASTSLVHGGCKLVPAGICFLRYAPLAKRIVFPSDTVGLAAGPTVEDAVVRAFLELVERDAVALWWYNRCVLPQFHAADLGDERIEAVSRYLKRNGRSVHFLDLTTDLDIPVAAAVSATAQGDAVLFGFAADFDRAAALRRAAVELLQILGPPEFWSRDAMLTRYRLRPDRRAWVKWASLNQHRYLLPSSASVTVPPQGLAPPEDRQAECLGAVRRLGLDLLYIDLTRSEVHVPVVRVIVPGLRSSWRRLGPGRLYDVPVRLGWVDAPTPEERLNSYPFFL